MKSAPYVPIEDRLKSEPCEMNGEPVCDLVQIRKEAHRCIDLGNKAVLAIDEHEGPGTWISFMVFEFSSGPATISGIEVSGVKMRIVFHGGGPSGYLRELRHTHWGNDGNGYLFYPSSKVILAAFVALKEWFDF